MFKPRNIGSGQMYEIPNRRIEELEIRTKEWGFSDLSQQLYTSSPKIVAWRFLISWSHEYLTSPCLVLGKNVFQGFTSEHYTMPLIKAQRNVVNGKRNVASAINLFEPIVRVTANPLVNTAV